MPSPTISRMLSTAVCTAVAISSVTGQSLPLTGMSTPRKARAGLAWSIHHDSSWCAAVPSSAYLFDESGMPFDITGRPGQRVLASKFEALCLLWSASATGLSGDDRVED